MPIQPNPDSGTRACLTARTHSAGGEDWLVSRAERVTPGAFFAQRAAPEVSLAGVAVLNQADPLAYELKEAPLLLEALRGVLDCHPDPLFVVDLHRRLRFRNVTGMRLLAAPGGFLQVRDRLSTGSAASDRRLDELLLETHDKTNPHQMRVRGLRLHRRGAGNGWLLVVRPLGPSPPAGNSKPLFLVHAASRMHPRGTLDPLLRDLFGLSTAERAAALAVIRTGSVDSAAASLSVSRETVRSQLKAVFRKCDIRSTLQLGALIRSVALFCGAERTWHERRAPSRSPNGGSVEPGT